MPSPSYSTSISGLMLSSSVPTVSGVSGAAVCVVSTGGVSSAGAVTGVLPQLVRVERVRAAVRTVPSSLVRVRFFILFISF